MTNLELHGLLDSYRGGFRYRLSDPGKAPTAGPGFYLAAFEAAYTHTGGSLQNLGIRRRLILRGNLEWGSL